MTQRTEVILKDDEARDKKRERFESVAISAAKQCQRLTIPKIHPPMKFKEAIVYLKNQNHLVIPSLMGEERKSLLKIFETMDFSAHSGIAFLIGPEGDFTSEEYQYAWQEGCQPVTLGESVLRVETAAIAVVSVAHLLLL